MGIPLTYEPPSSRSQANSKPDPTATNRSSIRRHGAIRHGRRNAGNSNSRNGRSAPFRSTLSQITDQLNREPDHERFRPSRIPGDIDPLDDVDWHDAYGEITRNDMRQLLSRDTFPYTSPSRRVRVPGESSLRLEMPRSPWSIEDVSHRPNAPPVPNLTHPLYLAHQASFTPRFAPAHPIRGVPPSHVNAASPAVGPTEGDNFIREGTMDASMPLLRRVGHRSVADARETHSPRHSIIDGLERSIGFEDDIDMQDTWERLLTTIQPDENLPSAESSFTSATATASSALSRNSRQSSSGTSTNTPVSSFGSDSSRMRIMFDPFPEVSTNCDVTSSSDGSDTEAESEPEHGRSRNRVRGPPRPDGQQTTTQTHGENNLDPPSQQPDNETPTSSTPVSFNADSMLSDLQQVHRILDRLARRDDIPEEWWTTAGLSRTIRNELNNAQPSNSGE